MNKKYAYCTVITNDDYTPCIIRQKQRMEYLKCKYPFVVIVTDNVPKETIKKLEDNDIEYKIVPRLSFSSGDLRLKDTINKLYALTLLEYSSVLFIEADAIIINNLDNLFYKYSFKNNQFFILFNRRYKEEMWVFGGFFFCKPSQQCFNFITTLIKKMKYQFEHDEAFFNQFFFNNLILEQPIYYANILHFSGFYKIWNLNYSFYNFLFNKLSAQEFNHIFNDFENIILLEQILKNHVDFWNNSIIFQEKIKQHKENNNYE